MFNTAQELATLVLTHIRTVFPEVGLARLGEGIEAWLQDPVSGVVLRFDESKRSFGCSAFNGSVRHSSGGPSEAVGEGDAGGRARTFLGSFSVSNETPRGQPGQVEPASHPSAKDGGQTPFNHEERAAFASASCGKTVKGGVLPMISWAFHVIACKRAEKVTGVAYPLKGGE